MSPSRFQQILDKHRPDLEPYETTYKHLHSNPELSEQESETAAFIAEKLKALSSDLEVTTGVGGHGLFAVLRNGEGKTVLLRADFDALPVREQTGLDYASKKTMQDADGVTRSVMHACGHDFHVTALLAGIEIFLSCRDSWSGTLVFVFQPAEEKGSGAQSMVNDGLYDPKRHNCPVPDLVLAQHVFPLRAGTVSTCSGTIMSAADSIKVTIHGVGGHGSMPHNTIDPIVTASHCVVRLQSIVSREVPPNETAVVTVGVLEAGFAENIIPHEAVLRINVRTVTTEWREKILNSIKRIIKAECVAGRCPREPTFERTSGFPLTVNDQEIYNTVCESFDGYFGDQFQANMPNALGSEDFGILATAVQKPYCFWFFGGTDTKVYDKHKEEGTLSDVPINHSPFFAPVIQPTLKTGIDAMAIAGLTFLQKS